MHVGACPIFQAIDRKDDAEIYRNELRLGDLIEPLGFDSLWGVEHHFTDYTMCPDVFQHLAYFAGRTRKVQLGSMVCVLPWHNPMRVAEEVSMLDHQSNGRVILGVGRGLGRVEFEGLGVDQNESRERFVESAEMVLEGLERGWCEYDGKFVKQVRRDIRPRPLKSFRGRAYAAAMSPESQPIMARLGVGLLVIPMKPWEIHAAEIDTYRKAYRGFRNTEGPAPWLTGWTFCDEDAGRAEEKARKYIGGYWRSVIEHYELVGEHLGKTKGYESYSAMQAAATAAGGVDATAEMFVNLHVWGTPEQCYDKVVNICCQTGGDAFTGVFSYAGMPYADAERSMTLFAKKVLPELQALGAQAKAA
ncbi:MAG: LLM class flavin-dependent oxidoreductase [Panacagrimonas sp.]